MHIHFCNKLINNLNSKLDMKITLSGTPGSGKSTAAKELAKKLGYRHFSMGDFQRELAKERGLTILEWGKLEATDKKYDLMVDEKQVKLGKENDNFVLDSWLAPKFIPDSFKIFLDADIDIRVKRRLGQKRTEESFADVKKAKKEMLEREKVNRERWYRYYKYDYTDMKNYDFVVDTTKIGIKATVAKILKRLDTISNSTR